MNYSDIYKAATNERWAKGLNHLPHHMIDGVVRYVVNGIPPGSFLSAVIGGDLFEALSRADDVNKEALASYGTFFVNYAPSGCFGSPTAVAEWVSRGGIEGRSDRAAQ